MKKAFMPLLFALVFICGCAGNRDFIKHPDGEFIAKNQNTAYLPLSRTVEYVNQEKGVLSGENPKAADIPGFDAAIKDLTLATELPPVDFSTYNSSSSDIMLDFIVAMPDFTRLLALNYKYGVESGQPEVVYSSLLTALRLDAAVAGYPYVIGLFISSSRMGIILEAIKDTASSSPLNALSVAELDALLAEVRMLQAGINQRWREAYLFEASMDDAVYMKFLKSHLEPQLSEAGQLEAVALSRDLSRYFAQYLADGDDTLYQEMLKKEEAYNGYLRSEYRLSAVDSWIEAYKNAVAKLDVLEALLLAVKCKVESGAYPESLPLDAVEYSTEADGFTISNETLNKHFNPVVYGAVTEKADTPSSEGGLLQLF